MGLFPWIVNKPLTIADIAGIPIGNIGIIKRVWITNILNQDNGGKRENYDNDGSRAIRLEQVGYVDGFRHD